MKSVEIAKHDIISSIILMIVAVIALLETRGLSQMSYVFPRTIGIILLVLSIMYFLSSLKKRDEKRLFEDVEKRKVIMTCLGMIGYLILIALFGFLTASIIYIWIFCWYLQKDEKQKSSKTKVLHAGITAIGVSGLFFVLFRFIFLVPLPPGLFFGG